ncbi:DUF4097 family beta strand repeat-containing protein [Streptosporangium saharense]|uniref:DUF4097 domain-containing protein n=1 Tax=Streptosporangium saharense TaxID=1706840 RepID=A0A7W7QQW2_9ACTN|nr:DUF4097 family beta strand repeat-containing protein [Streptosporangium saharense]MBB4917978.1 hypothetical protein [Streptosporangium saharense]
MKRIVAAGGLLAVSVLLTGCGLGNLGPAAHHETATHQVKEKVTKLNVRGESGDISVTEGSGSTVQVVEVARWNDEKPETTRKVDGETLFVSYNCPSSMDSCGVDYRIEIPKGMPVDLEAGSGNITLTSLTGDITVTTGSGDITGKGLSGKKVFTEVGSGNAELGYTAVPDQVEMRGGSGDVTIHLPQGPYDVTAKAGSGDRTVSVPQDPNSSHKVVMSTGSGNIKVLPN